MWHEWLCEVELALSNVLFCVCFLIHERFCQDSVLIPYLNNRLAQFTTLGENYRRKQGFLHFYEFSMQLSLLIWPIISLFIWQQVCVCLILDHWLLAFHCCQLRVALLLSIFYQLCKSWNCSWVRRTWPQQFKHWWPKDLMNAMQPMWGSPCFRDLHSLQICSWAKFSYWYIIPLTAWDQLTGRIALHHMCPLNGFDVWTQHCYKCQIILVPHLIINYYYY